LSDVRGQLRSPELIDFLHSGVAIVVGNAKDMLPALTRGFALRVSPDGASLGLFLAPAQSAGVVANLAPGSELALTATNMTNYQSVQIKSTVTEWQAADDRDAAWLDRYWALFQAACQSTGVPHHISNTLRCRRLLRVTVAPRALFRQTPGPGAGAPLEDLSAWR
jgi:hypothetical protein